MTTASAPKTSDTRSVELADLVERLTARVQARETIDVEAICRDHPAYAEDLRRLLPALACLADLSRSVETGSGPVVCDGLNGTLGDFRLLREVGRGGMGIVYEATQISLNRAVALKVLPFAATMDPRQLQRFKHEAQAAAMLHHPHIVPVFGVGCERGVHYYAMQLIEGRSLATIIEELKPATNERPVDASADHSPTPTHTHTPTPETAPVAALSTKKSKSKKDKGYFRATVERIAQAADALEYAHSMGVVHRDVKPANLLLDDAGQLWVTDFGLAKLDTAAGMTVSGDLIGTLRYMSPEQALARHGLVDHRTDVYSLGATLYELLTLRPVFDGKDKHEILKQIAFEEPVALRKLDKSIPAELETITLKALAKNPEERYATAGELAEDLRRYCEDKPIRARRPTVRQRLAQWSRRHPGIAATIGLTVGLLLAGVWAWNREVKQAETAARTLAAEVDQFRDDDRLPEALAVAQRAEALLPRFGGDASLRQAVHERVADLHLLNALEQALLDHESGGDGSARVNNERLATMYQQTFQNHGVDVISGDEQNIINGLRRTAVASHVAAVFAQWERASSESAIKERLGRFSEALDLDERKLISRLRWAEAAKDVEALKRLAAEAEADPPPPAYVRPFARTLWQFSCFREAERLLRTWQQRYPAHLSVNLALANTLRISHPPQTAEAIRFYTAAVAIRPFSPSVWAFLGAGLMNGKRYEEAETACRRAISLKPDYSIAHNNLGSLFFKLGRYEDSEVESRHAIALSSDYSMPHYNLGLSLTKQGRIEASVQELKRAIELDSDWADAHGALSYSFYQQGKFIEAEASARHAVGLRPDDPKHLTTLGNALNGQGRHADALAAHRSAIAIRPSFEDYFNVGHILNKLNRYKEAEVDLRSAIKLKPDYALAHFLLGESLTGRGVFSEAVEEYRLAHELGSKGKDWPHASEQWVRDAERLAVLAPRLPSLLAGESQPADATEYVVCAKYCQTFKKRYVAAARFYEVAFTSDPKLAEARNSYRYDAACMAARAARGDGNDAVTLDDKQRARLRRQALGWLTDEFAAWNKLADNAADRPVLRRKMQHWQHDPDFAGVRGDAAIAKLPADEQAAWKKLWADVAELLKRTEEPKPGETSNKQN
jgi:serine/threonine protein kinase/Flp pilus assembly protein TadD